MLENVLQGIWLILYFIFICFFLICYYVIFNIFIFGLVILKLDKRVKSKYSSAKKCVLFINRFLLYTKSHSSFCWLNSPTITRWKPALNTKDTFNIKISLIYYVSIALSMTHSIDHASLRRFNSLVSFISKILFWGCLHKCLLRTLKLENYFEIVFPYSTPCTPWRPYYSVMGYAALRMRG